MGLGVTKVGDIGVGVCSCHLSPVNFTATLITGAGSVLTNGMPTGIVGAIAISSCGHPVTIIVGSGTVVSTSSPTHRVGDVGVNCGGISTTITGSGTVTAG
jgi:hypothetical protein